MECEVFGLKDQHQTLIHNYLKFSKMGRQNHLKFIDLSFGDVLEQLNESTYTKDEVETIIDQLKDLVSSEVTSESISKSHMNALLLSQLFSQAERWHLMMNLDFSEIQDRELLEKVKAIEESEGKINLPPRLKPLDDSSGGTELLRNEIERLMGENDKLKDELSEAKLKLDVLENEKQRINELCEVKEQELVELKVKTTILGEPAEDNVPQSEQAESEQLLGEYEKVLSEQLTLELESMRQEFLKVQSQLTLAEQELERKFNQTAAYANMKSIISKKNDQVKELRNQLNHLQRTPQSAEIKEEEEGDGEEKEEQ